MIDVAKSTNHINKQISNQNKTKIKHKKKTNNDVLSDLRLTQQSDGIH